jgi:hypothetical protein
VNDGGGYIASSRGGGGGGSQHSAVGACFYRCRDSGCQGSGPGWWLCVDHSRRTKIRGHRLAYKSTISSEAASGSMAGTSFMGRSSCSYGLGVNLVSLVRRGCRLGFDAPQRRRLIFRPGRRPRFRCDGHGVFYTVQLGLRMAELCSVVARVRAVVSQDDGPGRCCWRSVWHGGAEDVGAVAPKLWRAPLGVGFFIIARASRVRSSHSGLGLFSPAVVIGCLGLSEWCFSSLSFGVLGIFGLAPWCRVGVAQSYCLWFSPDFLLINWAPSS